MAPNGPERGTFLEEKIGLLGQGQKLGTGAVSARNDRQAVVEVRVIEHMFRWSE